jgi:hypothetical protein
MFTAARGVATGNVPPTWTEGTGGFQRKKIVSHSPRTSPKDWYIGLKGKSRAGGKDVQAGGRSVPKGIRGYHPRRAKSLVCERARASPQAGTKAGKVVSALENGSGERSVRFVLDLAMRRATTGDPNTNGKVPAAVCDLERAVSGRYH